MSHKRTLPSPKRRGGPCVLAVLDPLLGPAGPYNFKKDTSHLLLLGLSRRGYRIYYTDIFSLFALKDQVMVRTSEVTVLASEPYFFFHETINRQADSFALILMRKDPPVNLAYLYAAHLLSLVSDRVRIVNRPRALQVWNEKLSILKFPKWIPPTLVSCNKHEIDEFIKNCGSPAIVKPLEGFAGHGVQRISRKSDSYMTMIEEATHEGESPVMVQPCLPGISEGEKRIFLIDGRPLGALLKIPPEGGFQTNPDLGGRLASTKISTKEKRLCQDLKPFLDKNGIFFAGIDVIDGKLTEINMTSPGLLWELNEIDNRRYEEKIVDLIEMRMI